MRNNSESTARVAMFSSIAEVGAVVYPDSDMIQIFTTTAKTTSSSSEAAPWT